MHALGVFLNQNKLIDMDTLLEFPILSKMVLFSTKFDTRLNFSHELKPKKQKLYTRMHLQFYNFYILKQNGKKKNPKFFRNVGHASAPTMKKDKKIYSIV